MAADTGNGATLTRTGFTVDIVSISIGNQTIDMLDSSLLSSTGFAKKLAADLADAGTFTVEAQFDVADSDNALALGGAAVSTTITFPGSGTRATLAGTAVLTDKKFPDLMNNEIMVASFTFTWDGATGPTFTAQTA
jgi:hypothetical protein